MDVKNMMRAIIVAGAVLYATLSALPASAATFGQLSMAVFDDAAPADDATPPADPAPADPAPDPAPAPQGN